MANSGLDDVEKEVMKQCVSSARTNYVYTMRSSVGDHSAGNDNWADFEGLKMASKSVFKSAKGNHVHKKVLRK